jgi:16S rRNA (guanine527-N7)-methyltransferase
VTVETEALTEELERSQQLGFLGPGPVADQIRHAAGFAAGLDAPPRRFLDLGSGGGVPGLVLATVTWPESTAVLLDSMERRCTYLREAVDRLGIGDRVGVVRARAEEAGREPALRATFDAVVVRSFGAPAVTAECAAPFLAVGGTVVVSEPPADQAGDRWPADGLAQLGLRPAQAWTVPQHFRALVQVEACGERYPRRVGVPAKRPLF